ncbi:MAG TPA: glycoside hydrolase family 130 protein, partial [Tepidisphaeraceae bacterium]|nr:glycoside hydrolase family 130 protein [Tepidisphaeraceae bacterium]
MKPVIRSGGTRAIASPLPNLPWQDRPAGSDAVIWRDDANPILGRNPFAGALAVYNSGVVPFEGGFAGVFRVDHGNALPFLHVGRSADGVRWTLDPEPIRFQQPDGSKRGLSYGYDPRVTPIEDGFVVAWCNDFNGPTIGLAKTRDFATFEQLENAFVPFNRNGVLFPRRVGGMYALLHRPSDSGHTPFGDIYLSHSPDLTFWGRHKLVMKACGSGWWDSKKIGAGPVPIETRDGWLLIYHGVLGTCNGFVYSIGAALLDLDEPWKVLARGGMSLLAPETGYETAGR